MELTQPDIEAFIGKIVLENLALSKEVEQRRAQDSNESNADTAEMND